MSCAIRDGFVNRLCSSLHACLAILVGCRLLVLFMRSTAFCGFRTGGILPACAIRFAPGCLGDGLLQCFVLLQVLLLRGRLVVLHIERVSLYDIVLCSNGCIIALVCCLLRRFATRCAQDNC